MTEIGAASMISIAGGVIYLAAYLPKHAPLGVAVGLLLLAVALQLDERGAAVAAPRVRVATVLPGCSAGRSSPTR